ncbi:MAG: flagellar brake protein [Lachnospirales bacterium]
MKEFIEIGSSIELSLVRDNKPVRTYKSKVESPENPNAILVQVPSVNGQLVKLPVSNSYEMIVYADAKLIKFKVHLTGYEKQDGFMYCVLKLLDKGEKVQRREYFRYVVQIPFSYITKKSNEANYNVWELDAGLIKDIGGGGIRFASNTTHDKDDILMVYVALYDSLFVAECKILFIDPTPEGSSFRHQYRVQFIDTFETEREIIVQYIFNEQRRILSKNRR